MCKCKVCICKQGETRLVCCNPSSNNYKDFVNLEGSCEEGIERMTKEEYEAYMKVGDSNEKSKSS